MIDLHNKSQRTQQDKRNESKCHCFLSMLASSLPSSDGSGVTEGQAPGRGHGGGERVVLPLSCLPFLLVKVIPSILECTGAQFRRHGTCHGSLQVYLALGFKGKGLETNFFFLFNLRILRFCLSCRCSKKQKPTWLKEQRQSQSW